MSLSNDIITIGKVHVNVLATVETVNKDVTKILFQQHSQIAEVINGFRVPMKIYQHTIVIITDPFLILLSFNISDSHFLHT